MRKGPRTGVCLNAGGDLTSANIIKEGDILAENSFEIKFANSFSSCL